jgi:hypothetical protein
MSDNRDEKLDNLLRARRVEPAGPDLARRIILAAQQLPQDRTVPLWQWIGELFREFHLPKPAYVLASALVLGMVIGFTAPQDGRQGTDDGGAIIQSFLSADEALL